jgi:hypothetical protein
MVILKIIPPNFAFDNIDVAQYNYVGTEEDCCLTAAGLYGRPM